MRRRPEPPVRRRRLQHCLPAVLVVENHLRRQLLARDRVDAAPHSLRNPRAGSGAAVGRLEKQPRVARAANSSVAAAGRDNR
jgi:hypothetical protein